MPDISGNRYSLALVTGGSSGIGLAFAEELVRRGTSVILAARSRDMLEEAGDRLEKIAEAGVNVHIVVMDVSDDKKVSEAVAVVLSTIGTPDLVYCGAGMAYPDHFHRVPTDVFDRTMQVNVRGVWNVLYAVVPAMKEAGGGSILTVSSVAGLVGTYGYSAYAASKFAVVGLSQVLRNELKPDGIDVKVLCPPDTDTPMLAIEDETKPEETRRINGSAGLMTPQHVARIACRSLKRRRFIILPGFMSKVTWLLYRTVPGLVHRIIDGNVAEVRKETGRS